jgi:hypothetical protein
MDAANETFTKHALINNLSNHITLFLFFFPLMKQMFHFLTALNIHQDEIKIKSAK